MRPIRNIHRTGFTLLEALLASVILAMAVFAITLPFSSAGQHERFDAQRTLAVSLAQEKMESILANSFANITAFDGKVEQAGAIKDAGGNAITSYASSGLTRSVSAKYVYVSGQSAPTTPDFICVIVTVSNGNSNPLATLTRLVYAFQ